jgi:solute carrier family 45, member 1/2/4
MNDTSLSDVACEDSITASCDINLWTRLVQTVSNCAPIAMTGGGFASFDGGGTSDSSRLVGQSHIYGPSFFHLPALTIGLLGVQLAWSTEMSYGSPYLLSLGLTKSSMAIVFVAGPLSGLVMAPLIGLLADTCTSKWGRRKPFMLFGTIGTILALLLLGWTKHVAGWFSPQVRAFPTILLVLAYRWIQPESLTIWLAVIAIYVIDFSINAGKSPT